MLLSKKSYHKSEILRYNICKINEQSEVIERGECDMFS